MKKEIFKDVKGFENEYKISNFGKKIKLKMAKVAKRQVKLSEVPVGSKIEIGGFKYVHKGFDKRKTQFGRQEHFIFWSEEAKQEKTFDRFKFSSVKVKQISEKEYEW